MNNFFNYIQNVCASYDWIHAYCIGGALQAVLSHNGEPSSLQAASVASSKGFVDIAHARITQDINNLELALNSLRVRRQALRMLSVDHDRALSKFRWLPNEILAQIFLHVCDAERFVVGCVQEGPWKLRRVCRKWAGVVEGCSQLWCDMVIHVAGAELCPATFAQILRFSGSRPLHITLFMEDLDYDYLRPLRKQKFCQIIAIIAHSSLRWESLTIEGSEDLLSVVIAWFPILDGRLPVLRRLKLKGAEHDGSWAMHPLKLSTLSTAPLLETVHMEFFNPDHIAQLLKILPIPCRQIRRLFCYSSKYQSAALYGRLSLSTQTFPRLERCVIVSSDTSIQSSSTSIERRIENDSVLHFVTSHADVLDDFSFPSLRTLSIGNPHEKPENIVVECDEISRMVFKQASEMLLASGCSLVSLVMSYTFTLVDEFLQLLDIVPTLEILDMRVAWWKRAERDKVLCAFLVALGNRKSGGTFSLLPALQDLRLSIKPPGWSFNEDLNYPAERRDFHFVSKVFGAIPERSRAPTEFRAFSLTMATEKKSSWRLGDDDIDGLLGLVLTRFVLEGPRSDFTVSEEC